jgi:hypothetical protein
MSRVDARGRAISGESFARLKTEHCDHDVLGCLQATPLDLVACKSSTPVKDRYDGMRWTSLHIDEVILKEHVRKAGVGRWLFAKWFLTEYDFSMASDKFKLDERMVDAIEKIPILRGMLRSDDTIEPFVTLCVDHENLNARKFYRTLGFVELTPSLCDCPGRIQCVNSASRLKERLAGALDSLPASIETMQRVRIRFTGEELESLLFQLLPRTRSCYDFGIEDFALAVQKKDPAATIAKTIADFYYDEFCQYIKDCVILQGSALLPIGVKAGTESTSEEQGPLQMEDEFVVKREVVYLFALDRLLMWKTPRVLMTADQFEDKKKTNEAPERTDAKQWEDTRYCVFFGL